MKKILPILFAVLLLSSQTPFKMPVVLAKEASSNSTVTAYYFHGNFRCPTCRKLEEYSKEAIAANFKSPMDSGKLVFKKVNTEEKGNEHYVTDYQLYTKSLVLSLVKDGKEVRSKNLDKIWEYVGNKQQFQDYVRDEVAAFLQEV